ncbi:MAG: hypothetical protein IKR48_08500 [Kiritimatiellae bacterium]|nr:hypothetical protein [Kiritimatiellia bacterium]
MSEIVLGVTGSIAAYKACELTRLLVKDGHNVHVIMTRNATEFVTPLTFRTLSRNSVCCELFEDPATWVPGHISLAVLADLVVVAPCTANVLSKVACGIADDLLTSTCLATTAPLLLAPAMNTGMYENAATQANMRTLRQRGIKLVEAGTGELACGTSGKGRMAEPAEIVEAIRVLLK